MRRAKRRYIRAPRIRWNINVIFLLLILLIIALKMLAAIVSNIYAYFSGLDIIGWLYASLGLGGLALLFGMSQRFEKQMSEKRLIQSNLILEEQKRKQIQKMKDQTTLENLKQMHWHQFEAFIRQLYDFRGYEAALTPATCDGGKDIILLKDKVISIVECKRYNSPKVTRPDIQKFHSAILDTKAQKGYFVTTGEFTKPAVAYCEDKPIELINGEQLVKLIMETIRMCEEAEKESVLSFECLEIDPAK
ncbi:restriction endonuclease [Cytobacillus firmus]|uniref:restriction endonuclease n=1 Tax=Cytobacillus firmus TaxID=1399 RepID=UPI00369A79B0